MRALSIAVVLVALSHSACRDSHASPATATSAPPPVASPARAAAPSSRLAQCPNAVPGATTALRDIDQGIELTVTAADDAAIGDIRARAAALVVSAKDPALQEKHGSGSGGGGGGGSGGGGGGRCPVVMKRTSVEARDTTGGSVITVLARRSETVDWLRRETHERQDEIAVTPK
jgi:TusA-related sulfurtransferase